MTGVLTGIAIFLGGCVVVYTLLSSLETRLGGGDGHGHGGHGHGGHH